ncbi:hypothetical protein EDC94DRAFT_580705 [Helicostylum pulchrum]|nr:hypothetical protein EDC94DRAFT_580705 [Helicostylum pulchrum]
MFISPLFEMSSLPYEILTLIFDRLCLKDLLQCQLTSKEWCRNSLTSVYSNADLYSGEEARLFIRAISNSPQLGLYLCGEDSLAGYRTICDQIDQFKNLRRPTFDILSYTYLTHFDGLIEKCPHLKDVDSNAIQRPNKPGLEPMIHPRPDIHTLECDWKLICIESQLEYVMRKFPNLQRLRILTTDREPEVSGPTFIKFIQYAMSTSEFSLRIYVRKEYFYPVYEDKKCMYKQNGSYSYRYASFITRLVNMARSPYG